MSFPPTVKSSYYNKTTKKEQRIQGISKRTEKLFLFPLFHLAVWNVMSRILPLFTFASNSLKFAAYSFSSLSLSLSLSLKCSSWLACHHIVSTLLFYFLHCCTSTASSIDASITVLPLCFPFRFSFWWCTCIMTRFSWTIFFFWLGAGLAEKFTSVAVPGNC